MSNNLAIQFLQKIIYLKWKYFHKFEWNGHRHWLCWCYISKWRSNTIPGSQMRPKCFQSSLERSSSGKLHKCGDCDAGCRVKDKRNHKGLNYLCDLCEYKTRDKSNLKKHRDSKHEGFKYSCNQCKYHAKQWISIKKHKESKHGGVIHSCNQCEY